MKAYREEVFIIEWYTLPQKQKDYVIYNLDDRISNGVLIKWPMEFQPDDLTMDEITKYWEDQRDTNGFEGNLEEFIKEYGLEFEVWIIKQNFDLTNIKNIYIDISW